MTPPAPPPSASPPPGDLERDFLAQGLELAETHISWVFLDAEDVWKVKKPVSLGFLDFSTLEARHTACKAEVHLNRRLAPHVYHACVPITRDAGGRYRIDGPGTPVDWAVHMVRLPEAQRADVRLAAGRLNAAHVARVAERLARFHTEVRSDEETARYGTLEVIAGNVRENFEQTRTTIGHYLSPAQVAEVEDWQNAFLEREAELLEARRRNGRVRDGHGDLRLEHVYLDDAGRVTVVDCIEFNQRFRFADVCADVAFLAMDLGWNGRVDLAERFLSAYAQAAGDYDLYPLVDFYESYRAFVRGKVSSLLAADAGVAPRLRERAAREARRYFLLALASERRFPESPKVVAVGGLIASGKSTVAEGLAAELMAPMVSSDRTRKSMLGVASTEKVYDPPFEGAYSPAMNEKAYAEVLRRAGAVLRSGRTVVLDASFRSRAAREAARRLARDHAVPFSFVECRCARVVALERLRRREKVTGVTDGREEIFDDFTARFEPVDELPEAEHLVYDSSEAETRAFGEDLEALLGRIAAGRGEVP